MRFGRFSATVDAAEPGKQLRCLQGLAAVYLGAANPLIAALRDAEHDPGALPQASLLFDCLPSLMRRRMLSTFGAVTWPRPSVEETAMSARERLPNRRAAETFGFECAG